MKAHGRSLADFSTLRPAEQSLLTACRQGKVAAIADERPTAPTPENSVRASFLRFLGLGGDEEAPVHEHGVQLRGAYVEGVLDLQSASVIYALNLRRCTFALAPDLTSTRFSHTVALGGCTMPGLLGSGKKVAGSVFLNDSFQSTGMIQLRGAYIDGQPSCKGACIDGKEGNALSADGIFITGDVFLHEGFNATGKVRLVGAQIDGDLIVAVPASTVKMATHSPLTAP